MTRLNKLHLLQSEVILLSTGGYTSTLLVFHHYRQIYLHCSYKWTTSRIHASADQQYIACNNSLFTGDETHRVTAHNVMEVKKNTHYFVGVSVSCQLSTSTYFRPAVCALIHSHVIQKDSVMYDFFLVVHARSAGAQFVLALLQSIWKFILYLTVD